MSGPISGVRGPISGVITCVEDSEECPVSVIVRTLSLSLSLSLSPSIPCQALYHVIHGNAGVEMQCIGHFKLLFSLLSIQGATNLQKLALQVLNTLTPNPPSNPSPPLPPTHTKHTLYFLFQAISSVTGNKKCVENIAEANVLQFVLLVLYMVPSCKSRDSHMISG